MREGIKNILVLTDFSPASYAAADLGAIMALRHGATLHFNHIIPVRDIPGEDLANAFRKSHYFMKNLKERMICMGVANVVIVKSEGDIVETGHGYVIENNIDVVIIGKNGKGGSMGLGGNALMATQWYNCPVLMVNEGNSKTDFAKILVPMTEFHHVENQQYFIRPIVRRNNSAIHITALAKPFMQSDNLLLAGKVRALRNKLQFNTQWVSYEIIHHHSVDTALSNALNGRSWDLIIVFEEEWGGEEFTPLKQLQCLHEVSIPILFLPKTSTISK